MNTLRQHRFHMMSKCNTKQNPADYRNTEARWNVCTPEPMQKLQETEIDHVDSSALGKSGFGHDILSRLKEHSNSLPLPSSHALRFWTHSTKRESMRQINAAAPYLSHFPA